MNIETLTAIHTALSFFALATGILAAVSLFSSSMPRKWISWFLVIAAATTITGFFFPFVAVTPAFATGIVASLLLLVVFVARYVGKYAGPWRWIYAAGVVANLYLMVFVSIAQVFIKTPVLGVNGLPFMLTQLTALALFIFLSVKAAKNFQP